MDVFVSIGISLAILVAVIGIITYFFPKSNLAFLIAIIVILVSSIFLYR